MLLYMLLNVIEREIFSLNMDLITVPWIFIIIMLYQYNIIVYNNCYDNKNCNS